MKQHAPATTRNREPIAEVLAEELPASGTVLELASGTGDHAVYFAGRFPALYWQPTDSDDAALASIAAWREEIGLRKLLPPLKLDAASDNWPVLQAEALYCCNMVHISLPAATLGLLRGAERVLGHGAPLIIYGPFHEAGVATAPSNLSFDRDLKMRNQGWGLRHAEWVDGIAAEHGFIRRRRVTMPTNNLILVYRRAT